MPYFIGTYLLKTQWKVFITFCITPFYKVWRSYIEFYQAFFGFTVTPW